MRIRTVKPEFWSSLDIARLSEPAALLAIGLLNYADDEGYFISDDRLVKAAVFPIRETTAPITQLLHELEDIGYIVTCTGVDGRPYGRVRKFRTHQSVTRPTPSKLRKYWDPQDDNEEATSTALTESSLSPHGAVSEDSNATLRPGEIACSKDAAACTTPEDTTKQGDMHGRTAARPTDRTGETVALGRKQGAAKANRGSLTESSLSPHRAVSEDSLQEQGTGNREQGIKNMPKSGAFGRVGKHKCRDVVIEQAELIYQTYPRHVGKKPALKSICRAIQEKQITAEALLEAVREYAAACQGHPDPSKLPYPATWVNNQRWEDDRREWTAWRRNGKRSGAAKLEFITTEEGD